MFIPRIFALLLLLHTSPLLYAQGDPEAGDANQNGTATAPPGSVVRYASKPTGFEFVSNIWGDLKTFVRRIDPKKNYKPLIGLTLGTALLVKYDQDILDESQRFARDLGLISDTKNGRESKMIIDFSAAGLDLPVRAPLNLNAGMYFIGDGITHVSIAGGLATYGAIYDDYRALNTASQIMEGIIVTGIVVQVIKRSTGRESPYRATRDGGRWDLFPSQSDYSGEVSKYDAMPSGHLATAMATTTILAANYPEKTWIKPTGYTLMGLLGFAMMNNGVHWASDYPLGIAIGYLAGDIAVERGKKRRASAQAGGHTLAQRGYFSPYLDGNKVYGIAYNYHF